MMMAYSGISITTHRAILRHSGHGLRFSSGCGSCTDVMLAITRSARLGGLTGAAASGAGAFAVGFAFSTGLPTLTRAAAFTGAVVADFAFPAGALTGRVTVSCELLGRALAVRDAVVAINIPRAKISVWAQCQTWCAWWAAIPGQCARRVCDPPCG